MEPDPPPLPVALAAPQRLPLFVQKARGFKPLIAAINSHLIAQKLPSIDQGEGQLDLRTYHLEFGAIPGLAGGREVIVVYLPQTPQETRLETTFRMAR